MNLAKKNESRSTSSLSAFAQMIQFFMRLPDQTKQTRMQIIWQEMIMPAQAQFEQAIDLTRTFLVGIQEDPIFVDFLVNSNETFARCLAKDILLSTDSLHAPTTTTLFEQYLLTIIKDLKEPVKLFPWLPVLNKMAALNLDIFKRHKNITLFIVLDLFKLNFSPERFSQSRQVFLSFLDRTGEVSYSEFIPRYLRVQNYPEDWRQVRTSDNEFWRFFLENPALLIKTMQINTGESLKAVLMYLFRLSTDFNNPRYNNRRNLRVPEVFIVHDLLTSINGAPRKCISASS